MTMKKTSILGKIFILAICLCLSCFWMISCEKEEESSSDRPVSSAEKDTSDKPSESSDPAQGEITDPPTTTESPKEVVMTALSLKFTEYETVSSDQDPTASAAGDISAWDRWASTDFIPVSDYYGLYYELAAHPYLMSLSFYDANYNYLDGVSTKATGNAHAIGQVIRPEQAVYARFVTFVGSLRNDAFILPYVGGFDSKKDYETYLGAHPLAGLEITCIGDSLTEGDVGNFNPGVAAVRFRNYPYYLSKALGCPVHNMGECGITASGTRDKYKRGDMDITTSDVILVMLGTNAGLKSSAGQYEAYLELLNFLERDRKEGAVIVLVTPPHASGIKPQVSDVCRRNVKEAAETVRALAKAKGYALIDAQTLSPLTEDMENIYQPNDGLHMSEVGYQAFADFIAEQLMQILSR